MKIRLDENLSYRVADAIKAYTANRPGFEVSWVGDDNPPRTGEETWLKKFADEGGDAVVSGDWNILKRWPDLVAYTESGLISFFPPPPFRELRGYGKASFILRWWPSIVEKTKESERGDRWRMPYSWQPAVSKFQALTDPRIQTDEQKTEAGIQSIATVHQFRPRAGNGRKS